MVVVAVGPVPVPIEVAIPINVSASAEVSGSVSVSANASMGGSVGIEYEDGDVSGISEFSHLATVNHSVNAEASAEARIGPDITVKAGWGVPVLGELAATAGLDVYSGLRLTYVLNRSPRGKLCVPVHAEGRLVFSIPVIDDITVGPETIIDEEVICVEFPDGELEWSGTYSGNFTAEETTVEPGWTIVETWTGNWQQAVDGTSPDGLTPEDDFSLVPASSEWTYDQSRFSDVPCVTYGPREVGSNPDSRIFLRLVPDGYQIYGGGGTGQTTFISRPCTGEETLTDEGETTYGNGGLGCFPEFETQPMPAAVDGVLTLSGTLSGGADCLFMFEDTSASERTWNLTVSCVGGGVPTSNWKC